MVVHVKATPTQKCRPLNDAGRVESPQAEQGVPVSQTCRLGEKKKIMSGVFMFFLPSCM